jgi:hypothetical protein
LEGDGGVTNQNKIQLNQLSTRRTQARTTQYMSQGFRRVGSEVLRAL